MLMYIARLVLSLLCALVEYCVKGCRALWFWANGGHVRTCVDGLCAFDCLHGDSVFRTLTRGSDFPDIKSDVDEDVRLRSRVLMVTMFSTDGGMSCPKTQTFLHARLKGFARAAPRARELARLSEKACGLPHGALKDSVVVIYADFEERVFAGEDVVVL